MRDQKFRLAALDAIGDIGLAQRRHRRDQHEPELHRRQHRRPQFGNNAQHHQETVATLGAERAQAVGEARRFEAQIGEGPRLDALADDFERDFTPMLSGRELGVEPFERPVELMRARPGEGGARAVIVVAELEQPVARLAEGQRLRSGAGRGEGGEGHEAIVTPLDGGDNAPGAWQAIRSGDRFNQRASSPQIKAKSMKANEKQKLLSFVFINFFEFGTFQWVTAEKNKKTSSAQPRVSGCGGKRTPANLLSFVCRERG